MIFEQGQRRFNTLIGEWILVSLNQIQRQQLVKVGQRFKKIKAEFFSYFQLRPGTLRASIDSSIFPFLIK